MATKKKIGIFLAARSGSKRLPNKHFLKINNKEHITPFIRNSKLFKKHMITNSTNYGNRRWTLDYLEDYFFFEKGY